MADNKPTLHHLNNSQSQRILWLLEELDIPYNLVLHERNPLNSSKPFMAPDSLVATGPYGKAPTLVTGPRDGNRVIPETLAIATYLIRTFDTEDEFGLTNGDWIRDEVICSVLGTNLGRILGYSLLLDSGSLKPGDGPGAKRVTGPGAWASLGDLERELKEGPKGGYFMGERPGRCDIMAEFGISSLRMRGWVDLKKDYPLLDEWLDRVYAREAWKRSLEKGNGYDLNIFPRIPGREKKL